MAKNMTLKAALPFCFGLLVFCLYVFSALARAAEPFTNSATLTAALNGTNLVITYSMTTTQGWVTLFSADHLNTLATQPRPVDLAQVPPSRQGQFTVPVDPGAPTKFYKLLIEQWPTRGKALVFKDGPLDFAAMRAAYGDITNNVQSASSNTNSTPMIFGQPIEVWLDNLGLYDSETGQQIGGNGGLLNGKYANTGEQPLINTGAGFSPVGRLQAAQNNDFRVNYLGDSTTPVREAVLWSSEVQMYYDV